MGIFGKIKRPKAKARDEPGARWLTMRSPLRTRGDYTMSTSEAIYAAVSRISNTIAELPIHLYKGQERQANHPLERLIAYSPNPCMTPFTFRQTMEACRNTEGNAYALVICDDEGRPARLDVLDPARVMPLREAETREMWYDLLLEDGKTIRTHHSGLIVLRHMSANGERGVRPVDVLRGTLNYDKDIKEFSVRQLEGINSGVILNIPAVGLSKEKRMEAVKAFQEVYESSGGRIVVLEGGITATTISQSPVDAKVLDVERVTRNRVATVYNIPPHMLGDYSDTSYATAEQSMLEYLQMTINPIVQQWEDELNRKLLTWEMRQQGYSFRFDLKNLWRTDMQTMANYNQMAIRSGWLMPNEVREGENLPADPNGNVLLASRDLVPLSVVVKTTNNQ
jgi:HK97 family phage portal protein